MQSPKQVLESIGNTAISGVAGVLSIVGRPLEALTDGAVNITSTVGNAVLDGSPGKVYNKLQSMAPRLEEKPVISPLGNVRLPEISLPHLCGLRMDERKRDSIKYAVAVDVSELIGEIPVVGPIVGRMVEDIHVAEIRDMLGVEELILYMHFNKCGPAVPPMIRMYMEQECSG